MARLFVHDIYLSIHSTNEVLNCDRLGSIKSRLLWKACLTCHI